MKRIIKIYYKLLLAQSLQVIFILPPSSFTNSPQILRERGQTITKLVSIMRKENVLLITWRPIQLRPTTWVKSSVARQAL